MTEPLRHIYSMAHILILQNRTDVLTSATSYPFSWHKKAPPEMAGLFCATKKPRHLWRGKARSLLAI
ncbi:TPA_asm: hypothetical protein G1V66_16370 [Salmonella enterica subsp. enterica serovar Typhi str. CT18]|uniref:Uncharacterized protein n=1 Tax=Salmonella enterica subsp. enterica serovar Typhi str. CT18 TaxID=220341 RepID=A0A717B2J9_SALTI|nr:hypothetical protein [Salmonella enterica subsp. enterica serovar Typhi str. CT18]HAD5758827.1 hypothetical protein [Salmonella enterica subsp. enterica serovar Typhi str. CT18]